MYEYLIERKNCTAVREEFLKVVLSPLLEIPSLYCSLCLLFVPPSGLCVCCWVLGERQVIRKQKAYNSLSDRVSTYKFLFSLLYLTCLDVLYVSITQQEDWLDISCIFWPIHVYVCAFSDSYSIRFALCIHSTFSQVVLLANSHPTPVIVNYLVFVWLHLSIWNFMYTVDKV